MRKRKTHEEYIRELVEKGILHVPLEQYVTNKTKILHQCANNTAHQWLTKPSHILGGSGCPICASNQRMSHEEYLAKLLHKGITHKPIERYITNSTRILHECLEKHQWPAIPHSILLGSRCPICSTKSSFDPTKPGKLYFVSFEVNEITYFKVGITTQETVEKRLVADWKKLKMQLLWKIDYSVAAEAKEAEKKILTNNKKYLVNTKALTSGNTETFSIFIYPPDY